jgi:hypothetical protein
MTEYFLSERVMMGSPVAVGVVVGVRVSATVGAAVTGSSVDGLAVIGISVDGAGVTGESVTGAPVCFNCQPESTIASNYKLVHCVCAVQCVVLLTVGAEASMVGAAVAV